MGDRVHDSGMNSPFKRGIIKELDFKKGRAKVEFSDEDGNLSYWLNVNQSSTGANKSYSMPDKGSQVNCLVDWDGEDGCIMGAVWSEKDKPPTENGDLEYKKFASGAEVIVDRKTGAMTIKGAQHLLIEADTVTIKADVAFEGEITSNGHDISSTHKHTEVVKGVALSGPPE